MKLYTVQHHKVWETLEKEGVYFTDEKFICDESFNKSYEWLNQMAQKHNPHWTGLRPVWCWVKRPDLRAYRFISDPDRPKKEKYVLLTLEIPDTQVLVSHFGLWHNVLNGFPVTFNEQEWNDWESKMETYELSHFPYDSQDLPENLRQEIYQSWERILKLNENSFKDFEETYTGEKDDLQAITPCLKKEQVVKVEVFEMINKFNARK